MRACLTAPARCKDRIMSRRKQTYQVKKGAPIRIWGRHPVIAALANPARSVRKVWGTREALASLDLPATLPITYSEVADLARLIPGDTPHQGIVAEFEPLDDIWLGDVLDREANDSAARPRPIVILDQVTDPHNVGAVLRSAAAFDACAVVTQDRHAPPESGVIARSASGALEIVPWVRVVNLARALEEIAEAEYWRIGLAGTAETELSVALEGSKRIALVLGAEGEGMRHNTMAHCDMLAKLPISPRMESLNVSNAAAIALYAVATAKD